MKKALLFVLLLCFALNACAEPSSASNSLAANPDSFLYDHRNEALPLAQSALFDAYYQVYAFSDPETPSDHASAHLQLTLINKSGKELHNLRFTAHFCHELQSVLTHPSWINEPIQLNVTEPPLGVIHDWVALIDLNSARILPGTLTLDCFYDILLEITCDEGNELLLITPADLLRTPPAASHASPPALLTESEVRLIDQAMPY